MALAVVLMVVMLPLQFAFWLYYTEETRRALNASDLVLDLIFWLDIFMNFVTAYMDNDGEIITDYRAIARYYTRSWFIIDLASTLPWGLFIRAASGVAEDGDLSRVPRLLKFARMIKLIRLVKVRRLIAVMARHQEGRVGMVAIRIWFYAMWLYLLAHVLACIWWFIAELEDNKHMTWASEHGLFDSEVTLAQKYITSLYWAFATVTTVGYGDVVASNDSEKVFTMICTFIGSAVFAFMVGKMSALASQAEMSTAKYREKMESVSAFMRFHRLPKRLRVKIRATYEMMHERGHFFAEDEIMANLNVSLRREVKLYLNKDSIMKVPFFETSSDEFIEELLNPA